MMATSDPTGRNPSDNPVHDDRPRDGARLDRLFETQRLLETLRRLGYGPSWVADRLGLNPATVTNWAKGRRVPPPDTLARLGALARGVLRNV
jgi:transcriptional regulator with XRE-family HTH domain